MHAQLQLLAPLSIEDCNLERLLSDLVPNNRQFLHILQSKSHILESKRMLAETLGKYAVNLSPV